jgi:hypothetical protein
MTAAEVQAVSESLAALGIEVVAEEFEVDEDVPVVSWESDLPGFLDAAQDLQPAEAYVGTLLIDEELVGSLEEDVDEEAPELEPYREIIGEARALLGQEAGTQAFFLADGRMHEYYTLTPAARALFERIEEFAELLGDDECGCGHDHDHDHEGGLN